jgi:hypothetical protein
VLSRTYCSDNLAFNASLAGLAGLKRLRHLDLSHTDVDGSGLANFCSFLQVLAWSVLDLFSRKLAVCA